MFELKMVSLQNSEFWVRLTGKPVYNDEQAVIGIREVLQNIDENKSNELNLQDSLDIIANQNSRIFNFAHIVSQHLRSHSSNPSLIVELLKESKTNRDKLDLLPNVEEVAGNLDLAISRLNDPVSIQTSIKKVKVHIKFEEALEIVLASICTHKSRKCKNRR